MSAVVAFLGMAASMLSVSKNTSMVFNTFLSGSVCFPNFPCLVDKISNAKYHF